jgi:transcriptional regulator with XRE-family HTH domain
MIVTEASTIDLPAWRHARGLSQPQLGNLLDVPVATVRNWEQQRSRPAHGELVRLALVGLDAERNLAPAATAKETIADSIAAILAMIAAPNVGDAHRASSQVSTAPSGKGAR